MSFTVTIDSLRKHQASVDQGEWESLLRNLDRIVDLEGVIANAVETPDIQCAVLLTPQPETGSMKIDYQWVGKNAANCGPVEDDFFTYVVFRFLLKYAGV